MAFGYQPPLPQQPFNALAQITPAELSSDVTLYTAGADGAVIETIGITTTEDAVAPTVTLKLTDGGTTVELGRVTLALEQGTDGTSSALAVLTDANVNIFKPLARRTLLLGPNVVLKASLGATLTADRVVDLFAQGFSYTAP